MGWTTPHYAFFNHWDVGLYTELYFSNKATSKRTIKQSLTDSGFYEVYTPDVYSGLCSQRVLVSECLDDVKLSQFP